MTSKNYRSTKIIPYRRRLEPENFTENQQNLRTARNGKTCGPLVFEFPVKVWPKLSLFCFQVTYLWDLMSKNLPWHRKTSGPQRSYHTDGVRNERSLPGAPARFQARWWADVFGEKIRREAPKKIFSLPTLVFSLPTLDLIAWVGKYRPAII